MGLGFARLSCEGGSRQAFSVGMCNTGSEQGDQKRQSIVTYGL